MDNREAVKEAVKEALRERKASHRAASPGDIRGIIKELRFHLALKFLVKVVYAGGQIVIRREYDSPGEIHGAKRGIREALAYLRDRKVKNSFYNKFGAQLVADRVESGKVGDGGFIQVGINIDESPQLRYASDRKAFYNTVSSREVKEKLFPYLKRILPGYVKMSYAPNYLSLRIDAPDKGMLHGSKRELMGIAKSLRRDRQKLGNQTGYQVLSPKYEVEKRGNGFTFWAIFKLTEY